MRRRWWRTRGRRVVDLTPHERRVWAILVAHQDLPDPPEPWWAVMVTVGVGFGLLVWVLWT